MYDSKTPVQQQVSSVEQLKEKKSGKVSQRRFNDQRPEFSYQQAIQKMANDHRVQQDVTSAKTQGGLPVQLKQGVEQLSGISMNDVKVHYNSSQPAQLQAHAYAQGSNIHLGPGQEKHLPHEAWHVVQQKQGRVQPTIQMKSGVPVNDSPALEKEADIMGAKALQAPLVQRKENHETNRVVPFHSRTVQRFPGEQDDNTVTEHGIKYISDGHDRVTKAEGDIRVNPPNSGRGEAQGRTTAVVRNMFHTLFNNHGIQFHGGHILAHHHGGSAGMQNMVPLEAHYNSNAGGGYKIFENSVDAALAQANLQNNSNHLSVKIEVTYPVDTFNGVLVNLVAADNANRLPTIQNDPAANRAVINAFRRIPVTIRMTRCTDGVTNFLGTITQPTNPRTPLASNVRHNASPGTIAGYDQTTRTHIYGPGSVAPRDTEDDGLTYHQDIKDRYKHLPKPGIIRFLPAINGFAGGVIAFIWMDPLGTQDKFGGTGTEPGTIPLGSDWPILHQGINPVGGAPVWRKGHYLNAQLHGPGHDSRNLVPITGSANALMSVQFEDLVKQSEALVNPEKGVFVTARGVGTVTRPGNWQRNDAVAANSSALWDAEHNLPQSISLRAVEGRIREDKVPDPTGIVVAQTTIHNYLNPGNGNLGRTELPLGHGNVATGGGALANDTHQDYETRRIVSTAPLSRADLTAFGQALDVAVGYDAVVALVLRYGNTQAKKNLMLDYLKRRLDYQNSLHTIVNQQNKEDAILVVQGIPRLRTGTGHHERDKGWKGPDFDHPPGGGASGPTGRTEITA